MTDAASEGPAVSADAFLGETLTILQPASGYRAGIDAVLLAAAAPVGPGGARVLDVGAGVGVVGLCIAARIGDARITLFERQPLLADLARRNVERNALASRVSVIEGDIAERQADDPADNAFDHVVTNPPFDSEGSVRPPANASRSESHVMPVAGLERWGRFIAAKARAGGTVTMIHRADRLVDVLDALAGRFGALTVRPVHSRAGDAAIRILVAGVKGSRAPLSILPGLVVNDGTGRFTPEVAACLSGPVALPGEPGPAHTKGPTPM